jgi:hypothetical protein
MPGSSPAFKIDIRNYLMGKFPSNATILDIGAGEGTYAELLGDYFMDIDAIEIHAPYIYQFNLIERYRYTYIADCRTHDYEFYNVFILGDILEHLQVHEAQQLLDKLYPLCDEIIVSVPYLTPQGRVAGVEWEEHKQPDLTPDVMDDRYGKYIKRLFWNDKIGVYIRR